MVSHIEHQSEKVYFVRADGTPCRVHDVGFGPPHAPPFKHRIYALGVGRAAERRFVAQDGAQRLYRFQRTDMRDLTPEALTRQLSGAQYIGRGRHEPVQLPW